MIRVIFIVWWWILWLFMFKQGPEADIVAAARQSTQVIILLFLFAICFKLAGVFFRAAWGGDGR